MPITALPLTQDKSNQASTEKSRDPAVRVSELKNEIERIDRSFQERGDNALGRIWRRDSARTKAETKVLEERINSGQSVTLEVIQGLEGKMRDWAEVTGENKQTELFQKNSAIAALATKLHSSLGDTLRDLPQGWQVQLGLDDIWQLHVLRQIEKNPEYLNQIVSDFTDPKKVEERRAGLLEMRERALNEARETRERMKRPGSLGLGEGPQQDEAGAAVHMNVKWTTVGRSALLGTGVDINEGSGVLKLMSYQGGPRTINQVTNLLVEAAAPVDGKRQFVITADTLPDSAGVADRYVFSALLGGETKEIEHSRKPKKPKE